MSIKILYFSIILLIISCNSNNLEKVEKNSNLSTEKIGELSVQTLLDSGLTVNIYKYNVITTINRKFKSNEIPIKICATFESNGFGNIDSLIIHYKSKVHKVRPDEYFTSTPLEIISIKKNDGYRIRFNDYNFDNLPDLAIYNSSSGMQNINEDIFIYNHEKDVFVYNKILSLSSNCYIDTINKQIRTFGQGGMASMIYNSETYMWEGSKLKLIKTVRQDFIDKINLFIKETKILIDTSWQTRIDTLSEKKILEMREKQ